MPHVTIPVEQAWDLVLVHHIQNFSNYPLGASRTRGRRARRCLVPKTTERQRDLVGRSVHESADLAHFFPGELPASYGNDIAHVWTCLHTISHERDPRLIIDFTARRGFPSFQIFVSLSGNMLNTIAPLPFLVCTRPFQFISCLFSAFQAPPFLLFLGPTPLECRCGLKSPDSTVIT